MLKGNLLNFSTGESYPAEILLKDGLIKCVKQVKDSKSSQKENFKDIILPGFIDSHLHIESTMLTPSRFAEAVVPHGTTSVVADPHEIANVLGTPGIEYMMDDAATVPLNVFFTAPSCVPATPFETSGAVINSKEIDKLLKKEEIVALGEMMNFPGVLNDDEEVLCKLNSAKRYKKPIDGHAPLLSGEELCKYIAAGISTDHECTTPEEVFEKRKMGMKVMLRQGSSARNLKDLIPAGGEFIVSDDKHPEDLIKGHVDQMIREAIGYGLDPLKAVKMVTINPAEHYNLNKGYIGPGKDADLVVVDNLENLNVKKVFISGKLVARDNKPVFQVKPVETANSFKVKNKTPSKFEIKSNNQKETVRVIKVTEGQLTTGESEAVLKVKNSLVQPDVENDILKISVVERYGHNRVSNGFIHGFKLKKGAIASSIAHDSHNIIVVGTRGQEMANAVNKLIENHGGLVITSNKQYNSLKFPVAGLMSNEPACHVASNLRVLQEKVKELGCKLDSPFMTLSFMALLVIPKLKISDQGLFDVEKFQFVDVVKN